MTSGHPLWTVLAVDEFVVWLESLDQAGQEKVVAMKRLLERAGPTLGRPYCDRIKGTRVHNLKELRPSSRSDEALRVLFYFDPRRDALLLVGGDKSGDWAAWYDVNIPLAEARVARHEAGLARLADQLVSRPLKARRKK